MLGVRRVASIDDEELDETNRNRFVGARNDDPVPGSPKVLLSTRLIQEINPAIEADPIHASLVTERAFAAIKSTDVVFGCFDEEGTRAILNELCAAYNKNYIDLTSDVPESGVYCGRVCVSWNGERCLACMDELDGRAMQHYLQTDAQREVEDRNYGINRGLLDQKGPSVSPVNGVIAALGVMGSWRIGHGVSMPRTPE